MYRNRMYRNRLLLSALLGGSMVFAGVRFSHALSSHEKAAALHSGVAPGGELSAFSPHHVTGVDKNTQTCPICKYPYNPAVQVWVNTDLEKNLVPLVGDLEKVAGANTAKKFKAFVIFVNPQRESKDRMTRQLQDLASKDRVKNVALAYLLGPTDMAVGQYHINTDVRVKNTVFVYKQRTVVTKFVNFVADKQGLASLNAAINKVLQ